MLGIDGKKLPGSRFFSFRSRAFPLTNRHADKPHDRSLSVSRQRAPGSGMSAACQPFHPGHSRDSGGGEHEPGVAGGRSRHLGSV